MSTAAERLKNPWLSLARLAWLALVLLELGLVIANLPEYFRQLLSLEAWMSLDASWTPQTLRAALAGLGLAPLNLAFIALLQSAIQLLIFAAIGGLIFWRKSNTLLGLFASFVLVGMGTTIGSGPGVLESLASPWKELITFAGSLVWPALFIFFFIFPDGRFVPRWTRLFLSLWALFYLWYAISDLILKLGIDTFKYFGNFFILISIAASLYSQVYRYLRVSGPVERQQTKWFLFALAIFLASAIFQNLFLAPFLASTALPASQVLLIDLAYNLIGYLLGLIALPLAIGIALFRYHLWDIDIVVRRTLVYSLLTATLLALYLASVVILQDLFQIFTGQQQSPVATVLSTLAIAALFNPLRKRIQSGIDHRFYRRRYNAEQTLQAFAATLRDEVDLDQLSNHLVAVVQETIQPESVSLWLRETKKPSPLDRVHG